MHVLLIEDNDLLRFCLAEVLRDAGAEVFEASAAEIALDMMGHVGPPAVVVSDINLGPGMDGFDFAAAARCRWPSVPVLLISGVASNLVGRRLGTLDRFLPKPFTMATLFQNINDLTGGRLSATAA